MKLLFALEMDTKLIFVRSFFFGTWPEPYGRPDQDRGQPAVQTLMTVTMAAKASVAARKIIALVWLVSQEFKEDPCEKLNGL